MYKLIVLVFIPWVFALLLKLLTVSIEKKKFSPSALVQGGGMPSGHTALVSSLFVGVYLTTGLSIYSIISLVFAMVTIRDVISARESTAVHAKILNKITKRKYKIEETIGHSLLEVSVGLAIGVIGPVLLNYII